MIPLIPLAYVAGAAIVGGTIGWFAGKKKKKQRAQEQPQQNEETRPSAETRTNNRSDLLDLED